MWQFHAICLCSFIQFYVLVSLIFNLCFTWNVKKVFLPSFLKRPVVIFTPNYGPSLHLARMFALLLHSISFWAKGLFYSSILNTHAVSIVCFICERIYDRIESNLSPLLTLTASHKSTRNAIPDATFSKLLDR